jgi:hypothetical protein
MAILYGYFDESGKHQDHPVVTFSGVCAMESKIPAFNDAWGMLRRLVRRPVLAHAPANTGV